MDSSAALLEPFHCNDSCALATTAPINVDTMQHPATSDCAVVDSVVETQFEPNDDAFTLAGILVVATAILFALLAALLALW